MTDITHWQWNGLQYVPSNTIARVQRGKGNIIFTEEKASFNLKSGVSLSNQINKVAVNPDNGMPKKEGKWTITYFNQEPIMIPELEFIDPAVNWDKRLVMKPMYTTKLIEAISDQDKAKYYFYYPDTHGGWTETDKHWLIWWDISSILSMKDPNGDPFIDVPSGDPDIDNWLPVHKLCLLKIPLPLNLNTQ